RGLGDGGRAPPGVRAEPDVVAERRRGRYVGRLRRGGARVGPSTAPARIDGVGAGRKLTSCATLAMRPGAMRAGHVVATFRPGLLVAGCQQAQDQASAPAAAPKAPAGEATMPTADTTEVIATYAGKKLTSAEVLSEIDRLPGPSRTYLSAPDR